MLGNYPNEVLAETNLAFLIPSLKFAVETSAISSMVSRDPRQAQAQRQQVLALYLAEPLLRYPTPYPPRSEPPPHADRALVETLIKAESQHEEIPSQSSERLAEIGNTDDILSTCPMMLSFGTDE
jgi:hypothetical protein